MLTRRRRISVRVEHRQESISIAQMDAKQNQPGATRVPMLPASQEYCPTCGTPWHTPLQNALSDGQIGTDLLQFAIQERRLHLQQQPDGQIWVCELSLRQLTLPQGGEIA